MKKEICGFCRYSMRDGYTYDLFCTLDSSQYVDNFIAWDHKCEFWEERENLNGKEEK